MTTSFQLAAQDGCIGKTVNLPGTQNFETAQPDNRYIHFSLVTAHSPSTVTKTFCLDAEGKLQKTTVANVYAGRVKSISIKTLAEFAQVLQRLESNNCLVYGVAPGPDLELVTDDVWSKNGHPAHQVARTDKAFCWPNKAGGVLMLDYDPPATGVPLDRESLVRAVRECCPGLASIALLWWSSASSNIVNTETGQKLTGLRGQRLYMLVSEATDIVRAAHVMQERLWLRGFGHYDISKSGALLQRSLFDSSVWQANRIDFAAGAHCLPPLAQERGLPVILNAEIEVVDTLLAMPDLTPEESAQVSAHKRRESALVADQAQAVRDAWVKDRSEKLAKRLTQENSCHAPDVDDHAHAVVKRVIENNELLCDFDIEVKARDGSEITVGVSVILDNPYLWHGCLTKDPLEPTYDGGRWVGKLYLMGSRPTLHSFAHGGQSFRLIRQLQRIELERGKLAAAVDALLEIFQNAPDLYDFGTEIATSAGNGQLLVINKDTVRYAASRVVQFWRWQKMPRDTLVEVLTDPPPDVCNTILAMGSKRGLKPLDAVVSAPLMRLNGCVMSVSGYDSETHLLLDMTEPPPRVPTDPTVEQLRNAWTLLWKPFSQFPFASATDRAVLLATILTAIERPVLSKAPASAIDAPRQGSGKTLIAECISILATGKHPVAWPHIERNEDEVRKRLLTALRSGERVLLWDNITGSFDSAALAVLLTSDIYTDRVLGASRSESYPNRMLILLTGNNFTPSGELPRRVLTCRLDAQSERPFTRDFTFNPADICLLHRQEMVAAALTLMCGYVAAGRPQATNRKLGSFEEWDRLVRQAVLWIGLHIAEPGLLGDPIDSILERADSDPADEAHVALMMAWQSIFGERYIFVRELLEVHRRARAFGMANNATIAERHLADCLDEFSNGRQLTAGAIGKMVAFRRDRPAGGMQITRSPQTYQNSYQWKVSLTSAIVPRQLECFQPDCAK